MIYDAQTYQLIILTGETRRNFVFKKFNFNKIYLFFKIMFELIAVILYMEY